MTTHLDVPQPVDPVLVPALSGVYAPVPDERDLSDLRVVGELPSDLRGVYLRNGPNPLYPPLGSYTFPLDGDGMVHGIWILDDGTVRYRNRFVWTPQLRAEQRTGKALWGGLLAGYVPGPDVVPAELAKRIKPLPDINIIRHAGRTLALAEVLPPWELTEQLERVGTGPYTWGGVIPGMCAHPKRRVALRLARVRRGRVRAGRRRGTGPGLLRDLPHRSADAAERLGGAGRGNIAAEPLAVVPLPFRVPLGLHGNWFGSQRQGG